MQPDHLTPKQAAAALNLKSAGTLCNWRGMKPPKGPRWIKHGRRVLYPIAAIEAYKRENFLESKRDAEGKALDLKPGALE